MLPGPQAFLAIYTPLLFTCPIAISTCLWLITLYGKPCFEISNLYIHLTPPINTDHTWFYWFQIIGYGVRNKTQLFHEGE